MVIYAFLGFCAFSGPFVSGLLWFVGSFWLVLGVFEVDFGLCLLGLSFFDGGVRRMEAVAWVFVRLCLVFIEVLDLEEECAAFFGLLDA